MVAACGGFAQANETLATAAAPSVMPMVPASVDLRAMDRAEQFDVLFPGQFTPHERDAVEAYMALNAAINARGDIDIAALIAGTLPADTPGLGPVIHVTPEWLAYQNDKYDPLNPIRHDDDVARAAGYLGVAAYPTYGAHDDSVMTPWPPEARD